MLLYFIKKKPRKIATYIKTKTTEIYDKIDTVVEPLIDLLKSLENDSSKIVGEEKKIKEEDSLIRKIYSDAIGDSIPGDESGLLNNIDIAANNIKDAFKVIKNINYYTKTYNGIDYKTFLQINSIK